MYIAAIPGVTLMGAEDTGTVQDGWCLFLLSGVMHYSK